MSRIFLDLRVEAGNGGVTLRTVYQAPDVTRAGIMPFTASDGLTVIAASPSGAPAVSADKGRVTVFLRTRACPLVAWGADAPSVCRISEDPAKTAYMVRRAVCEFRRALRGRRNTGDSRKGSK